MNQPATLGALVALIVGCCHFLSGHSGSPHQLWRTMRQALDLVMYVAGGLIAISLLALFTYSGQLTLAPLGWRRILQMLLGGLAGVIIVTGSAFAFAKVNPAGAVALIVFGQMAVAVCSPTIWALTGQSATPIDWRRIAGLCLFAAVHLAAYHPRKRVDRYSSR